MSCHTPVHLFCGEKCKFNFQVGPVPKLPPFQLHAYVSRRLTAATVPPPHTAVRSGQAPQLDFGHGLHAAHGLSLLLRAQPAGGGPPRTLL